MISTLTGISRLRTMPFDFSIGIFVNLSMIFGRISIINLLIITATTISITAFSQSNPVAPKNTKSFISVGYLFLTDVCRVS